MEKSLNSVTEQTGINKQRIMRALTLIRHGLTKDGPEIFSGNVEVDETYLGDQWKNKRKTIQEQGTKLRKGTQKQPVFGILYRNGSVWDEVFDDVGAETLQPLISEKVTTEFIICSDTWKAYAASHHEDTSIVSLIMVTDNTRMKRKSYQCS